MGDRNISTEKRLTKRKHVKLPLMKDGERSCWVTVLHDVENGADIVIGAGTKKACIDAFERMSPFTPIDRKLVYFATWRKAQP